MSRNKEVLQLMKEQKDYFIKQHGKRFPDENGESQVWIRIKDSLEEEFEEDDWGLMDNHLVRFSNWHMDYSQYAWVKLRDKDLQRKCFAHSAWCGYQAIKVRHEIARIRQVNNVRFAPWQALSFWSNLLLAGWQDEADEVMGYILESKIGCGVKGIIFEGANPLDTFAHFLIELDCLRQEKPYQREDFRHTANYYNDPKDDVVFIYDPMLENWNTTDLGLVDELITQMCDYHVSRTVEEPEDIPEDEEDYYEFNKNNAHRLYPFEVLAWLKIRELSGLDNPKDFFHPLMNQALAEPVSDKPLAKPVEDKETNQILELVRKHFPEAKI